MNGLAIFQLLLLSVWCFATPASASLQQQASGNQGAPSPTQATEQTQREIAFLPARSDAIVQGTEFEEMKKKLAPTRAKAEKEEIGKPRLLIAREEGCKSQKKLEYKPGEPIEQVCVQPNNK